jgi:hypothetical protein
MWQRLEKRPLDLYILCRALAATWAFMPFQVFFLQARGLSLSAIFDLNVVFSLATVVFEVPTGVYADRYGRRVAMALGGFVMTAACAFFIIGGGNFWIYAVANVLFALSGALTSGADAAYLYDHLQDQHRLAEFPRLEGLSWAAKNVSNLLGALVAGAIFAAAPVGVFVFTGLLTAIAGLLALGLPEPAHPPREGTALDDFLRAAQTLRGDGRLLVVIGYGALTFVLLRISLFADQPHLEIHLTGRWGAYLTLAATLLAAGKELGGVVLSSSSGTLVRRVGARALAVGLAVVAVAAYAVMSFGDGTVDVAMMVLLGSAIGLFSPLMRTVMNRLIPHRRDRATLLSFESMGRRLLFAAASPLFGRAAEASSLHATFAGTAWLAGGMYAALGVALLVVLRGAARMVAAERERRAALVTAVG